MVMAFMLLRRQPPLTYVSSNIRALAQNRMLCGRQLLLPNRNPEVNTRR